MAQTDLSSLTHSLILNGALAPAALAAVPPLAFLVGWATAQFTVRRWLRQLP